MHGAAEVQETRFFSRGETTIDHHKLFENKMTHQVVQNCLQCLRDGVECGDKHWIHIALNIRRYVDA